MEQLESILKKQLRLLKEMLGAAQKQRTALTTNDPQATLEAAQELEALSALMNTLERERQEAQKNLEKKWGLTPSGTLAELAHSLPAAEGGKLLLLRGALREQAEKLAAFIEVNNLLTKNALAFTGRLLRIVGGGAERVYVADGKEKEKDRPAVFFDRSV
ncbi:MAG: flagellar protein FlgN [Desulfotomaculales bacterium]